MNIGLTHGISSIHLRVCGVEKQMEMRTGATRDIGRTVLYLTPLRQTAGANFVTDSKMRHRT